MTKKLLVSIKILIAATLLYFLFTLIDFDQFVENIKKVKVSLVILAVFLYFPSVYIAVLRWNGILRHFKIIFHKSQLVALYLTSGFLSNFLPTSVGGDAYKYLYMQKAYSNFKKEILSSIILERGFGFLSLFIVNIILIFPFRKIITSNSSILAIEAIISIIFAGFLCTLITKNRLISALDKSTINVLLFKRIKAFIKTLTSITEKRIIINSFLYSFFSIALTSVSFYLLFYSFGYKLNIFYITLVSSVVNIFSVLPISLNSIGISEGLCVFLFSVYGIKPEVSLGVALMGRILLILLRLLGGLVYVFANFRNLFEGDILEENGEEGSLF